MIPVLTARFEDTGDDWDDESCQYFGSVVLEFGGWEVTRWRVPSPISETNEEYAAEFVAKKLAELLTKGESNA